MRKKKRTGVGDTEEDVEELAGAKGARRARGEVVQQAQQCDSEHRAVENRTRHCNGVCLCLLPGWRHRVRHGACSDAFSVSFSMGN